MSESVTPIDLAANTAGTEIKVGKFPEGVAITPDGKTAYVTNANSESVTPIDLAANTPGAEIKVGKGRPEGVAITPDGKTAYVTNIDSDAVTPIDVATNTRGPEIKVGEGPEGVAITPSGLPVVASEAASAITQSSATLNGLVDPNGGLVGGCAFEYGLSPSYGSMVACSPASGFGPGPVALSAAIAGLAANGEYHFRITASNEDGASTSPDRTFRTLSLPAAIVASVPASPAISDAVLTNRRFRVASAATAISARKAPRGTSFQFTLSVTAKLQITITRSVPGLRHGHSCLAPSAGLRRARAKHCTRTLTVGTLTRAGEPAGPDKLAFSGRIGRHALPADAYAASLSASNTTGHSAPVKLSFTVIAH